MKSMKVQIENAAMILFGLAAVCIITSLMSGCGTNGSNGLNGSPGQQGLPGYTGLQGPAGPAGPEASPLPAVTVTPSPEPSVSPEPSATPNPVTAIVNDYNAWRTDNGQESINPGLDCNLYTVPNTTTAIIGATLTSVGAFTYAGVFNQPQAAVTAGFNVLPNGLQAYYQTWFVMKCTGFLVVATDDYHSFSTTSDDGSNLYVDGVLVVNNDGLHTAQTVVGERHLQDTVHSFELDFFQGGGNQQLQVDMDGQLVPAANLYH